MPFPRILSPRLPRHGPTAPRILAPLAFIITITIIISFATLAHADCECGYLSTINDTTSTSTTSTSNNKNQALFTDLLETDFTRLPSLSLSPQQQQEQEKQRDWAPQAFNLTRQRARGEYGEMFAVENINLVHKKKEGGEEEKERGGVELVVRGGGVVVDGMVPVAELDTERMDLFWGTFRAMMRVSGVRGTCAAFFWYFDDTQEIDMEFLSKDFNATNSSYPVNLVLQSREAAMAGYDASKTGNFVKVYLPFDPSEDFHEYRIDYLPGRVFFYADGVVLAQMDGPAVPSSPGHLILQHWSNGNKYWSGGPPAEDAALVVMYVKAYFNSSLVQRQQDWENRCRDPTAPNAVCRIPDVTPGNSSAADWFFKDHGNMTNNQTISEQSEGLRLKEPWWPAMGWLLLVAGLAVAL
ncbi:beta-glucanase [Chaetomidium leptoderma]|uniref:Beta-glucanase n=1 Tax=Chaetomidium leptoderma TaxID=669021 RepID=A0AAN7A0M1_9PEZI|nr:beta-glucanase [Chaetomidium leptoderma]